MHQVVAGVAPHPVIAVSTRQGIGLRAADEGVVSGLTINEVGSRSTFDAVVANPAPDAVGIRVAVDRVVSVVPAHEVVAGTAKEPVVAGAAP